MIISRKTRIDVAMELIEDIRNQELADAFHAQTLGTDSEIIDSFIENADRIDRALEELEQII